MEVLKGKEFISQKLSWLQKGGIKALERVTGDQGTLEVDPNAQNPRPTEISDGTAQPASGNPGPGQPPSGQPGEPTDPSSNKPAASEDKNGKDGNFDDELLWSNQYSYDEFIQSLSSEYEERGTKEEEKRHWSYPRRWAVRLSNLKITNLTTETISCFAEFDFGGSRNECRVQVGSNNYILNRGKSKNYIRTPVIKDVEKDAVRNFNCTHNFEYRGSYLDLEKEKLRIRVWKCQTYTINMLESIFEDVLIKFAEGDEQVEIEMFKYTQEAKVRTCKLSFRLFFQEMYDFQIGLYNFKINNAISSYYLFNYFRFHLSNTTTSSSGPGAAATAGPTTNTTSSTKGVGVAPPTTDKAGGSGGRGKGSEMLDWNLLNKVRYSIFKFKMERKMKKINRDTKRSEIEVWNEDMVKKDIKLERKIDRQNKRKDRKEKKKKSKKEGKKGRKKRKKGGGAEEEEDGDEEDEGEGEEVDEDELDEAVQATDTTTTTTTANKGVGFVTNNDTDEDRETTLVFMSENKEYISILREYVLLFVQVGTFHSIDCKLPPSPRLAIKLRTRSLNMKKMGLMSHSVRNAFSCEWDNLGDILFRGTLSELRSSVLEIKLLDWSAPKAANCIGVAKIPLESAVDYPFISSNFEAPEWLKLKSQYEGWGDHLEDLHLGAMHGKVVINRKPRYRQNSASIGTGIGGNSQLLIVYINNVDQLLINTQEAVDSYVEVEFNNARVRTIVCKDMLGPIYNQEVIVPIHCEGAAGPLGYHELTQMGVIRLTVWGYVLGKLQYFGSTMVTVREVLYNRNNPRPLSKKTHYVPGSYKYEEGYETKVLTGTRRIYHYQYNNEDYISNISFSMWFYPDVPTSVTTASTATAASSTTGGTSGTGVEWENVLPFMTFEEKVAVLFQVWKRVCNVTDNHKYVDYFKLLTQYGNEMFSGSFVRPLHPPLGIEGASHIFHYVSCISFTSKPIRNAFTVDFTLAVKNGNVLDHCILLCSLLVGESQNTYVAIGQQKDKKINAFVVQYFKGSTTTTTSSSTTTSNSGPDYNKTATGTGAEDGEVVEKKDEIVIYDFVLNQIVKIKLKYSSSPSSTNKSGADDMVAQKRLEWLRREMKRVNFTSVNVLFNNKNVWVNVQEDKNPLLANYDINNINHWYPFIPYNPSLNTSPQYYHKVKNFVNHHINSTAANSLLAVGRASTPAPASTNSSGGGWGVLLNYEDELNHRLYFIDWYCLNDFIVQSLEVRLLDEINRSICMYRTSQNLTTNFNKCDRLQAFLKKYLTLVHGEKISSEENVKFIRSQIAEWKEELERRIPRSYQVLIRTLHFNTVDDGVIFDTCKHRINFLDSRDSTSIFATAVKIFKLASRLYSTYFLVLYSSKIHEKVRREILLHRFLINRKRVSKRPDSAKLARTSTGSTLSGKGEGDELYGVEEEDEGLGMGIEDLVNEGMDSQFPATVSSGTFGGSGDLSSVVNKNLEIQSKVFVKMKTSYLASGATNIISSHDTITSNGGTSISNGATSISNGSSSISNDSSSSGTNGSVLSLTTSTSKSSSVSGGDGEYSVKELMKMPSYDYTKSKQPSKTSDIRSRATSSNLQSTFNTITTAISSSGGGSYFKKKTSAILKDLLTNSGLGSSFSIEEEEEEDEDEKEERERNEYIKGRIVSFRGNSNLHASLERSTLGGSLELDSKALTLKSSTNSNSGVGSNSGGSRELDSIFSSSNFATTITASSSSSFSRGGTTISGPNSTTIRGSIRGDSGTISIGPGLTSTGSFNSTSSSSSSKGSSYYKDQPLKPVGSGSVGDDEKVLMKQSSDLIVDKIVPSRTTTLSSKTSINSGSSLTGEEGGKPMIKIGGANIVKNRGSNQRLIDSISKEMTLEGSEHTVCNTDRSATTTSSSSRTATNGTSNTSVGGVEKFATFSKTATPSRTTSLSRTSIISKGSGGEKVGTDSSGSGQIVTFRSISTNDSIKREVYLRNQGVEDEEVEDEEDEDDDSVADLIDLSGIYKSIATAGDNLIQHIVSNSQDTFSYPQPSHSTNSISSSKSSSAGRSNGRGSNVGDDFTFDRISGKANSNLGSGGSGNKLDDPLSRTTSNDTNPTITTITTHSSNTGNSSAGRGVQSREMDGKLFKIVRSSESIRNSHILQQPTASIPVTSNSSSRISANSSNTISGSSGAGKVMKDDEEVFIPRESVSSQPLSSKSYLSETFIPASTTIRSSTISSNNGSSNTISGSSGSVGKGGLQNMVRIGSSNSSRQSVPSGSTNRTPTIRSSKSGSSRSGGVGELMPSSEKNESTFGSSISGDVSYSMTQEGGEMDDEEIESIVSTLLSSERRTNGDGTKLGSNSDDSSWTSISCGTKSGSLYGTSLGNDLVSGTSVTDEVTQNSSSSSGRNYRKVGPFRPFV